MSLRQLQQLTIDRIHASPFVQAAFARTLERTQYHAWLLDLYHGAHHAPHVLARAGGRLASGHPQIADYLLGHAAESLGHDGLLLSDLCALGVKDAEILQSQPSNPCLQALALQFVHATHFNPLGLFGWLFVLKSVGGQLYSRLVPELDASLNLQGRGVGFLSNAAFADAEHAHDLLTLIDQHLQAAEDRDCFVRMMGLSTELYLAVLDHAVGRVQLRPARPPLADVARVPAPRAVDSVQAGP